MTQEQHEAMFKQMRLASCIVVGWNGDDYSNPPQYVYMVRAKHEQIALSLMLDLYS